MHHHWGGRWRLLPAETWRAVASVVRVVLAVKWFLSFTVNSSRRPAIVRSVLGALRLTEPSYLHNSWICSQSSVNQFLFFLQQCCCPICCWPKMSRFLISLPGCHTADSELYRAQVNGCCGAGRPLMRKCWRLLSLIIVKFWPTQSLIWPCWWPWVIRNRWKGGAHFRRPRGSVISVHRKMSQMATG